MEGIYHCDYWLHCKHKNLSKCEGCSYKYRIETVKKPPIGIEPKYVHDKKRLMELCCAITRYLQAGFAVPLEWVEEYNQLLEVRK